LEGDLVRRLAAVRVEVAAAAARAARDPAQIRIVAVTKTFPPEVVRAALAAGLEDVGENYVQEARDKRRLAGGAGVWHLIGPLQRNKANVAAGLFEWVETIESTEVAEALARAATAAGRRLRVLIQVNVAGEPGKHGIAPEAVEALAGAIHRLPSLDLQGLMTVPPQAATEESRGHFRALREVRDRAATRLGVELPHLSMGMSADFAAAVEEGATMLRLGRVLFGARGAVAWREGS
jgi:hypothetical protein